MKRDLTQRLGVTLVAICLTFVPFLQTASAAIVTTDTAIDLVERQTRVDRVNEILAREVVQDVLVDMGVDPLDAQSRVAALTDAELLTLEEKLDKLPAGGTGFVEAVGLVAIVLIVLELLNVTNFFSEF